MQAPTDIVYLVKTDPENDSEELRYSLRSLSNIPHGKVFIVGEKPDWAVNITYVPVPQLKSKSQNWAMNLTAAVKNTLVSDDFVMMNDDFFIMKKMPELPNIHFGPMKQAIAAYDRRYPEGSEYISKMKKLYDVLLKRGFETPISYELHTPMLLNKEKVLRLYRDTQGSPLYQFRTYYGNYFAVGGTSAEDVKVFLAPEHNSPAYVRDPHAYLESQSLLSTTGGAFKRGLAGDFVRAKFPERSPYES